MISKIAKALDVMAVGVLALVLYLPNLSMHYDLDGVAEAMALEDRFIFTPNHLLYRAVGYATCSFLGARRLVWTFCIASQDGTQSSRCDKHVRTGSSCGPDRRRFRRDWIFVRAYHHSRSLAVGVRPRRRGVTVLGKI